MGLLNDSYSRQGISSIRFCPGRPVRTCRLLIATGARYCDGLSPGSPSQVQLAWGLLWNSYLPRWPQSRKPFRLPWPLSQGPILPWHSSPLFWTCAAGVTVNGRVWWNRAQLPLLPALPTSSAFPGNINRNLVIRIRGSDFHVPLGEGNHDTLLQALTCLRLIPSPMGSFWRGPVRMLGSRIRDTNTSAGLPPWAYCTTQPSSPIPRPRSH